MVRVSLSCTAALQCLRMDAQGVCVCVLPAAGDIDVNADRDERGNTLLLVAAQNGLKRIAKMLLRKGADINAVVRGVLPMVT